MRDFRECATLDATRESQNAAIEFRVRNFPRRAAQHRRAVPDRRLLACLQLSRGRHDLPAREPAAARAAREGARQAAPARALGREPGLELHVRPPEPTDQQVRPRRDLPRRPRPRRAGRARAGLSRGHLLGDLPGQGRGRGRDARVLQRLLVPGRDRQPLHARDARLDPRGRGARLQRVARLRRGVRQSGSARDRRGRRRRSGDGPARDLVALEQVPEPDPRRRRAAGAAPERLQDQQSDAARAHLARGAPEALRGLRLDAAFRRRRRPRAHAPADGRDARGVRPRDPPHPAGGARERATGPAALADDRAAHSEGLDGTEAGRRQEGRRLSGARTRCRSPACTRTRRISRSSRPGCAATGPRSSSTRAGGWCPS